MATFRETQIIALMKAWLSYENRKLMFRRRLQNLPMVVTTTDCVPTHRWRARCCHDDVSYSRKSMGMLNIKVKSSIFLMMKHFCQHCVIHRLVAFFHFIRYAYHPWSCPSQPQPPPQGPITVKISETPRMKNLETI